MNGVTALINSTAEQGYTVCMSVTYKNLSRDWAQSPCCISRAQNGITVSLPMFWEGSLRSLQVNPSTMFLTEQIFQPLGMVDTGFYVPGEKIDRLAGMYGPVPTGGLQTIDAPEGGTGHISKTSFYGETEIPIRRRGIGLDGIRFCPVLPNALRQGSLVWETVDASGVR